MISTRAEIGLRPIAFNRCCNQAGLSLFVTFLKYLPATPGQIYSISPLKSFSHLTGLSNVPSILLINLFSFNFPNPAAAKSLATPLTENRHL